MRLWVGCNEIRGVFRVQNNVDIKQDFDQIPGTPHNINVSLVA